MYVLSFLAVALHAHVATPVWPDKETETSSQWQLDRLIAWLNFPGFDAEPKPMSVSFRPLRTLGDGHEPSAQKAAVDQNHTPRVCKFLITIHEFRTPAPVPMPTRTPPTFENQITHLLAFLALADYDSDLDAVKIEPQDKLNLQQRVSSLKVSLEHLEIISMDWWNLLGQALESTVDTFMDFLKYSNMLPLDSVSLNRLTTDRMLWPAAFTRVVPRPDNQPPRTWQLRRYDQCIHRIFPSIDEIRLWIKDESYIQLEKIKKPRIQSNDKMITPCKALDHTQKLLIRSYLKKNLVPEIIQGYLTRYEGNPLLIAYFGITFAVRVKIMTVSSWLLKKQSANGLSSIYATTVVLLSALPLVANPKTLKPHIHKLIEDAQKEVIKSKAADVLAIDPALYPQRTINESGRYSALEPVDWRFVPDNFLKEPTPLYVTAQYFSQENLRLWSNQRDWAINYKTLYQNYGPREWSETEEGTEIIGDQSVGWPLDLIPSLKSNLVFFGDRIVNSERPQKDPVFAASYCSADLVGYTEDNKLGPLAAKQSPTLVCLRFPVRPDSFFPDERTLTAVAGLAPLESIAIYKRSSATPAKVASCTVEGWKKLNDAPAEREVLDTCRRQRDSVMSLWKLSTFSQRVMRQTGDNKRIWLHNFLKHPIENLRLIIEVKQETDTIRGQDD